MKSTKMILSSLTRIATLSITMTLASIASAETNKKVFDLRTGIISWYGPNFHGKRTANGEVYNQNALTTAHMSLPFGTRVKMTCTTTGKSVIVRVNDRGNFAKYGRTFDVSKATAEALGFVNKGVTKVRYEILD